MPAHKSGKKNRKVGRSAKKCQKYRTSDRRYENKLRRVRKHKGQIGQIRHLCRSESLSIPSPTSFL